MSDPMKLEGAHGATLRTLSDGTVIVELPGSTRSVRFEGAEAVKVYLAFAQLEVSEHIATMGDVLELLRADLQAVFGKELAQARALEILAKAPLSGDGADA